MAVEETPELAPKDRKVASCLGPDGGLAWGLSPGLPTLRTGALEVMRSPGQLVPRQRCLRSGLTGVSPGRVDTGLEKRTLLLWEDSLPLISSSSWLPASGQSLESLPEASQRKTKAGAELPGLLVSAGCAQPLFPWAPELHHSLTPPNFPYASPPTPLSTRCPSVSHPVVLGPSVSIWSSPGYNSSVTPRVSPCICQACLFCILTP